MNLTDNVTAPAIALEWLANEISGRCFAQWGQRPQTWNYDPNKKRLILTFKNASNEISRCIRFDPDCITAEFYRYRGIGRHRETTSASYNHELALTQQVHWQNASHLKHPDIWFTYLLLCSLWELAQNNNSLITEILKRGTHA